MKQETLSGSGCNHNLRSNMSSRARNFRRRADDDDSDDANGDGPSSIKPTSKPAASTPIAAAAKPKKPPKLLSFADDEENDSTSSRSSSRSNQTASRSSKASTRFNKLSSSSSHKITSTKDRLTPSSASLPSNVQPQAGTYTKEALRELQKNTKTLASSRPASSELKPPREPVIVLKGLVKPMSVVEGAVIDEENVDEELETSDRGGSSFKRDKEDTETRLASMGIGKGRGSIPDQATINAIRARRERLRQSRAAAPDYISLDGGSNHGAAEGLSDEEPEFQGRIAMFGEKPESGKKGVFEDVDERGMEGGFPKDAQDSDDEEEKIWEEEQFRKGLGKRIDDGSTRVVSSSSSLPAVQKVPQQNLMYSSANAYSSVPGVSAPLSIGGAVGPLPGTGAKSLSDQAELTDKALRENLRMLKESHGRTMSSLTRTDENLSSSLANISALEKSLTAAGEKFIFMQKLRDFVSVICDFLQHKAPFIEELEEQMQKLHEERASAILERRAADDDEMMEIQASVDAAMSVFRKSGSSEPMVAAARTAAQAASSAMKEQTNVPVKLDELGRDLNLQKRMEKKRRSEAQQRRRDRWDVKRMSFLENETSRQQIEGESSTDESDSETAAYQSTREMLLQTAAQIFSDAADEYSQLSSVKERIERWKKMYSSSYRDAYMSLSAPAIFSPYVRLELLKWDPLYEEADFDDMKWHSLLFNYGMSEDGNDFSPDDADANLVPELVERVALPILHHELAHCWDIFSARETKNAVSATNLVIRYIPASSEALGELLAVVHKRLYNVVSNFTVPPWNTLVMKAVPNAARVAAYRFGMSIRLMRNICLWKDILALPVLEKLVLDQLLSGQVLPHVENIASDVHDAITRTERIISSLSGVWAGPSVTGERSKLQPLVDYVVRLGKKLEKRHLVGMTESDTSRLARRLKRMLVELNEYDKARDISKTFHLKEAL